MKKINNFAKAFCASIIIIMIMVMIATVKVNASSVSGRCKEYWDINNKIQTTKDKATKKYKKYKGKKYSVKFVKSQDKLITSRKGKVVIEQLLVEVASKNGTGTDQYGKEVKLSGQKKYVVGDEYFVLLVYNPLNNKKDDVIEKICVRLYHISDESELKKFETGLINTWKKKYKEKTVKIISDEKAKKLLSKKKAGTVYIVRYPVVAFGEYGYAVSNGDENKVFNMNEGKSQSFSDLGSYFYYETYSPYTGDKEKVVGKANFFICHCLEY